mmetsp:Transcript_2651/g.8298  ORF Transcript_2651/g.8298 Transcript_2651/m.8298 type:complete len:311 (-) Transcript_2651:59-991(-)
MTSAPWRRRSARNASVERGDATIRSALKHTARSTASAKTANFVVVAADANTVSGSAVCKMSRPRFGLTKTGNVVRFRESAAIAPRTSDSSRVSSIRTATKRSNGAAAPGKWRSSGSSDSGTSRLSLAPSNRDRSDAVEPHSATLSAPSTHRLGTTRVSEHSLVDRRTLFRSGIDTITSRGTLVTASSQTPGDARSDLARHASATLSNSPSSCAVSPPCCERPTMSDEPFPANSSHRIVARIADPPRRFGPQMHRESVTQRKRRFGGQLHCRLTAITSSVHLSATTAPVNATANQPQPMSPRFMCRKYVVG